MAVPRTSCGSIITMTCRLPSASFLRAERPTNCSVCPMSLTEMMTLRVLGRVGSKASFICIARVLASGGDWAAAGEVATINAASSARTTCMGPLLFDSTFT